jgi:uncharacterized protein YqeY
MGNLKNTIIGDRDMAMKMHDAALTSVLRTLIGELDRVDKNPSDDVVLKTISKIVDANIEFNMNEFETAILSQYLPKKLSELEITTIVKHQITTNQYTGMKDMGKIMKFFQDNYPSQYDGKLVSNIIKTELLIPAN